MRSLLTRALGGILTASTLFFLSGCASIVHSGDRAITLRSDPSGARATIRNEQGETIQSGRTPMQVNLNPKAGYMSGQSYRVTFSSPGYEPAEYSIRPTLSGWYYGNLLVGGLIGGLIVDPITGAMWDLKPNSIEARLAPGDRHASLETGGDAAGEMEADSVDAADEPPAPVRPKRRATRQTYRAPETEEVATAPAPDSAYERALERHRQLELRLERAKADLARDPRNQRKRDRVRELQGIVEGSAAALDFLERSAP